jgi:uncharacterized protein YgbK (DUF1537 family)
MARVLVTADDCTGALEVAGVLAERTHRPVRAVIDHQRGALPFEPSDDGTVLVVDLGSRHVAPDDAARRIVASVERVAPDVVAHKFDSTLRGNWASEVVAAGRLVGGRVLVVPALRAASVEPGSCWSTGSRSRTRQLVAIDGTLCGRVGPPSTYVRLAPPRS